jgi:hypothetical protein
MESLILEEVNKLINVIEEMKDDEGENRAFDDNKNEKVNLDNSLEKLDSGNIQSLGFLLSQIFTSLY